MRQIVGFDNFRIKCQNFISWPVVEWGSVTTTGIENTNNPKGEITKITNILGQKTKERTNTPLLYRYENGKIEKRIIIE